MTETEPEAPETQTDPETGQEPPQPPDAPPEAPEQGDGDEEPSEPAPEPQEPPSEPSAPPQPTPEALERRSRSAEQRFTRYGKGIEELYEGSEVRLVGCPLCPDQHKGFVDLNFAGRIPEEVAENVKYYLGMARPVELKKSRKYHRCDECDGRGKVDTDSLVPGQDAIGCEACQGRGFNPAPGQTQQNGVTGPTQYTPAQLEAATQAFEDVDEWGEPRTLPDGRENPNFGKMPNRKIPVAPWGVTAGLTALDANPA